ncbi:hypothetical protein, partial [Pseudomonas sp. SIMBA_068]
AVLQPHQPLQVPLLLAALQALIVHHDALRSTFVEGAQGWSAAYRGPDQHQAEQVLWQTTLNSVEELEALGEEAQRSLDLGAG